MRTSAIAVWSLLLASASAGALAAQQEARGFYVGGLVGSATLDDGGLFAGSQFDDSGTSYGIYGGYKFFRYLSVEGRLQKLGSFSVDGEGIDVTSLTAHVVGIIPFGMSGWEIFGQLGVGSAKFDTNCCGGETNTIGSAGLGVRFYPNAHLGISLQVDAYAYDETYLSSTYNIGVTTTQLGIHYLF